MSIASGASALTGLSASSTSGDATSIAALRSAAARDPKAAIQETARQFEALFMQQLMKSMREATMSSGMLDNSGTQLGTEMLDTQYANKMSGLPGGLAAAIARQLERQLGSGAAAAPAAGGAAGAAAASSDAAPLSAKQIDFIRSHQDAARAAEAVSGIPAAFTVAQAAHESGWGQREIRNADGSSAHNLFGIKAGAGWTGPVAEITTTEYVGGEAQKVTAKFRAYASTGESFRDYAKLMKESPRYAGVVAQAAQAPASAASAQGFAQGLQRAGYATDPAYASKLSRLINTTLRMQKVIS
ncbi:MAG TPA: glucosaminidase domain-containing protein [Caldimonas sp.]|jgi:flagellar protein FlgJ|nr:glucosaminidase domain-containing protein [Caldimonas sp.]HEV7575690.1 glucosaminidase domain-containing protein [Caldimonas sp.]